MRIKICRKESKGSAYWLKLIEVKDQDRERKRELPIEEATELMKSFGSIVEKAR